MLKTCFASVLLLLVTPLTACASSCGEQYTQDQLDEIYQTTFGDEARPIFNPNTDAVTYKSNCKYLDDDEEFAKSTYEAFNFISKDQYLLYQCENEVAVEIEALPKYLKTHIETVNGQCEPKFNPLGLRSYAVEFSKKNGELVKLYRMVE